ncbi:tripartite ATP-independent transporter DctP family solute receptor [Rhodovulum sulfidophilum]|uniref:TRAP transporter substrate-binding protein n=1 Tax=Rhodovulum sulfidophilum TaxID=35806 RepID=UPI0005A71E8E|nr:TRAP transporter substrate-binding protein [Rhodovulum sulfidophilum]ANB33982.1 C4-dicarboxylate ABC transporter substrate-binding protein [Rhodovulum sulfidophilum DSM 1374]ANB37804.1 C4-dicarboxylate ABC transporter substrate-binding protein [Rhodovulum sulfidophilum]MCW2304234.1 tripartite ATP-independent transporter DctP family solute receptor [Rhodovulum sulfidophilum]NDK36073.1 TRAP transporter substrate-binding protein [Rhodovulum sulfidophilum]
MKPLLPRAFGLCLGLSLLAGAASAQTVLRVAGNFPEEHSATGAMNVFKEEVERLSGGDLVVQNFPAMQLGGAQENVDQVRSGAIFAVFTSIAYFTRSVPELEAVSLPFLFDSREKAFEVMDGPVGKLMDKALLEQGFVNLGYGELGFRHVTNSVRPLTRLEDFQGLKIRLQPNEVHLETFRALGANPQSLDISELYSALQQKVLDGEENPYNIIYTRRFFEVQKYLSDTGHFFDFINVVANKDAFDALSPDNQEAVRSAMRSAIEWQRAEAARVDLEFREKLVAEGMQFDEIPAAERARLREATASIAESLKERVDPEVIDLVLEQAAQ